MIKDIRFAMLTTCDADGTLHSRPMASKQADSFHGELWFFTKKSSHKIKEVHKGSEQVNVSYSDPDNQSYVSISGVADLIDDKVKSKELWTDYMKTWFPGGLDDPDLTLLRVKITTADYWNGPSSKIGQLYGMAKAAITGDQSSLGEHKTVNVH